MRHIIYSTYKDILHEMESLTSSNSYNDLLSIVKYNIIKSLETKGQAEKTYNDIHKSANETMDHLITNLKIDKEVINKNFVFKYAYDEYRKKTSARIIVEAEKTLKVLDHIGFIAIFDLKVRSLFYNNDSVLFPPYFESKQYVESLDNERFLSDFSKTLHFVTDENVKYANEILSITEKQGEDETHDLITKNVLQEIKYLVYSIEQLEEKGITTKDYNNKTKAYSKLIKRGYDVFGVDIPQSFPFENPSSLYHEIDYLLSRLLLSNEQKRAFYYGFNIRDKIPKVTETEELFNENDRSLLWSLFRMKCLNHHDQEADIDDLYLEFCKEPSIEKILKKPKTNDVTLDEVNDFSFEKEHFKQQSKQYSLLQNKFLNYTKGKRLILNELGLEFDTFAWYQD